jgi:RNA polymerase sigma factor for flagellar operon FliA
MPESPVPDAHSDHRRGPGETAMTARTQSASLHRATGAEIETKGLDSLLRKHTNFVRRLAYRLVRRLPPQVDVRDLIQAGFLGLIDAAHNFVATRNTSFRTYAGIRIRGAMIDSLRQGGGAPRAPCRWIRDIAAATWDIESKTGKAARPAEIASELGVAIEKYHRMRQDSDACRTESLEGAHAHDSRCLSDTLPDERADIAHDFEQQQLREALATAIDELPERERAVILLYYCEELCLREIGEQMKVSESRVCQIRSVAIERLRTMARRWISDELLGDNAAKPAAPQRRDHRQGGRIHIVDCGDGEPGLDDGARSGTHRGRDE